MGLFRQSRSDSGRELDEGRRTESDQARTSGDDTSDDRTIFVPRGSY